MDFIHYFEGGADARNPRAFVSGSDIETPSQAAVDSADQWLVSAHEAVQAISVGGYVNYVEPNTAASRYFGDNLVRLNAIRQKYDPAGLITRA